MRISSFLGVLPAEFSPKTYRIQEIIPTPRRSLCGIVSYSLTTMFFIFRTSQMFLAKGNGGNTSQYAICAAHCFLFVLMFGMVLQMAWFKTHVCHSLNQNFFHVMEFRSKFLFFEIWIISCILLLFLVKWMPSYNPETEMVSWAMTICLKFITVTSIFLPWVGLVYFAVAPDAPIFPNTVVVPWIEAILPIKIKEIPFLILSIHGLGLILDVVLLVHSCYFGLCTVIALVAFVIIYLGRWTKIWEYSVRN